MLRQVSSRNHRRKGEFRAKNALQICIFVAVCVWLLYQMNHSHARRKAYAESFDRGQSDITRYGRKDLLPSAGSPDSVVDAKVKEDAEVKEHEEGAADNHRADGRDEARAEHTPRQVGAFGDQEHDERSREAREKSFKGDDASSEVVHYGSQDIEHEERTQQARERSFRADDASSAVDHVVVQVQESESETELLDDSFKGTNSSVIRDDKSTLPGIEDTTAADVLEKTEPGVAHTKIDERSSSSTTTGEADENMEEQTDLGIVDHVDNETKPQTDAANESVSRIELGVRSIDLPKNQIKAHKNHTAAVSEDWTEAQENQTTANVTVLRNQTSLHPLINSTANLQTPWKEDKTENTMMIQKSDKTARPEESEEGSKTTTAIKDDHNKALLQRSKDYLGSMTGGERKDERNGLSGLKEIQNKVEESGKEEAAE